MVRPAGESSPRHIHNAHTAETTKTHAADPAAAKKNMLHVADKIKGNIEVPRGTTYQGHTPNPAQASLAYRVAMGVVHKKG